LARVFSVLGGGLEGALNLPDLSLKNSFSLSACATHAITMNTLMFNRLAVANPKVSFVHTQPGIVDTNILRNMNSILKLGARAIFLLAKPWSMTATESGERHCWEAMADDYKGNGKVYLVGSKGDIIKQPLVVTEAMSNGTSEKVNEHIQKVFKDICETSNGIYDGE
jgi:hypothetical protein